MLKYRVEVSYTKVGEVTRSEGCPRYEFDNGLVKRFLEQKLREQGIPFDKWEMGPDTVSAWQRQITFIKVETEE